MKKRLMITGLMLLVSFVALVVFIMYMIDNPDFYQKVYDFVYHSVWGKLLFK